MKPASNSNYYLFLHIFIVFYTNKTYFLHCKIIIITITILNDKSFEVLVLLRFCPGSMVSSSEVLATYFSVKISFLCCVLNCFLIIPETKKKKLKKIQYKIQNS